MNLSAFSNKDKQNFMAILTAFEADGILDYRFMRQKMQDEINQNRQHSIKASGRYKPDNVYTCFVCGKFSIKVPVNRSSGTQVDGDYNFAIQCQNRPTDGKPWESFHCGHTEYIIEAVK